MPEEIKAKRFLVQARLSEEELALVNKKLASSACRTMSEYVRKVILAKPVVIKHRNQSLDELMGELIALRGELNAIGNNYNQVVKRLYSLQHIDEVKTWLTLHDSAHRLLADKMSEI